MGRRKVNTEQVLVRLPKDVLAKVRTLLEDPMRPGKLEYGALQKYVTKLIVEDLSKRKGLTEQQIEELIYEFGRDIVDSKHGA